MSGQNIDQSKEDATRSSLGLSSNESAHIAIESVPAATAIQAPQTPKNCNRELTFSSIIRFCKLFAGAIQSVYHLRQKSLEFYSRSDHAIGRERLAGEGDDAPGSGSARAGAFPGCWPELWTGQMLTISTSQHGR